MYQQLRLEPYAVHTTFQYAGTDGKRHRLREAKVFYDPPEYYDSPGNSSRCYLYPVEFYYNAFHPHELLAISFSPCKVQHILSVFRLESFICGSEFQSVILTHYILSMFFFLAPSSIVLICIIM